MLVLKRGLACLKNDIGQSLFRNYAANKVRRFHLQITAHLHAATLHDVFLADYRRINVTCAGLHQCAHDSILDEAACELVPVDDIKEIR